MGRNENYNGISQYTQERGSLLGQRKRKNEKNYGRKRQKMYEC